KSHEGAERRSPEQDRRGADRLDPRDHLRGESIPGERSGRRVVGAVACGVESGDAESRCRGGGHLLEVESDTTRQASELDDRRTRSGDPEPHSIAPRNRDNPFIPDSPTPAKSGFMSPLARKPLASARTSVRLEKTGEALKPPAVPGTSTQDLRGASARV